MKTVTRLPLLRTLAHLSVAGVVCGVAVGSSFASIPDHHEFEATLHVPFLANAGARSGDESRTFTMEFDFPHNKHEQTVA